MRPGSVNWNNFWDLATPAEAADILFEFYGSGAVDAATSNAVAARADYREQDARFWKATRAILRRRTPTPRHPPGNP